MNIIIQETIINPILQIDNTANEIILTIEENVNNINVNVQEVAIPGQAGKSFYALAVQSGFQGTPQEYLEIQKNIDGGLIY